MVLLSRHQSAISFDIKLKNTDRQDVIVIRGHPLEASAVFLSGAIVLSLADPINIKRVSVKLYATLRLSWTDPGLTPRGTNTRPYRYDKILYEYDWDNLDFSSTPSSGQAAGGSRSLPSSPFSSSHHLTSPLSQQHLQQLNPTNKSSGSHTFSAGNYEIPFEAILPGDMPESVEGLDHGMVVYKLKATIDRGRFSSNLIKKKHVRVVRTLGTDDLELSQSMSLENTWPGKVDYEIHIPAKAVAIGSSTPVELIMVPMVKGLKLGKITISLYEYTSLQGHMAGHKQDEKLCFSHIISATESGRVGQDKWEIIEYVPIPASLAVCRQDCLIANNIKITHKLKFTVALINSDGHTSELRASLPISLFISPSVPIKAGLASTVSETGPISSHQSSTGLSSLGSSSNLTGLSSFSSSSNLTGLGGGSSSLRNSSNVNLGSLANDDHNERLFSSSTSRSTTSLDGIPTSDLAQNAPPNYQNHVYDRLWSDLAMSNFETPAESIASTPFLHSRRNSTEGLEGLGMTTLDVQQRAQLQAGLQQVLLDRLQSGDAENEGNNGTATPSGGLSTSSSFLRTAPMTPQGHISYLNTPTTHGDMQHHRRHSNASPGVPRTSVPGSPAAGLRLNSPSNMFHFASPVSSSLDLAVSSPDYEDAMAQDYLGRVPSYDTAMRSDYFTQPDWVPEAGNDSGQSTGNNSVQNNHNFHSASHNHGGAATSAVTMPAITTPAITTPEPSLAQRSRVPNSPIPKSNLTAQLSRATARDNNGSVSNLSSMAGSTSSSASSLAYQDSNTLHPNSHSALERGHSVSNLANMGNNNASDHLVRGGLSRNSSFHRTSSSSALNHLTSGISNLLSRNSSTRNKQIS
ncbi:hypothetical protein NADFUDRAFT_83427 [Nadsonia fulvescens var. elongata DSM 6958]|uniref:Arrestin C-terminal-like domain-containing protein n=1 Tax=Nadsonia fulvescens var. elongata DSM 6958 TaxID=857566 RepID=A0A1E3PJ36_9ASCO|nr:hypothetical protein NADFUDRAFT_83427 [Nadsonia fulvescens var. elongata DSM 6958]